MRLPPPPQANKGPSHRKQLNQTLQALIIGDSIIKDITGKKIKTCNLPYGMVSDINQKLATIILENPKISQIIVHAGLMIFKENSQNF